MNSTDAFWGITIAGAGLFASYFLFAFIIYVIVAFVLFLVGIALPYLVWGLIWALAFAISIWPLRLQLQKRSRQGTKFLMSIVFLAFGLMGVGYGSTQTFHVPQQIASRTNFDFGLIHIFGGEDNEAEFSDHGRYLKTQSGFIDCNSPIDQGNNPGACADFVDWLDEFGGRNGRFWVANNRRPDPLDQVFGIIPDTDCNDYVFHVSDAPRECDQYFEWLEDRTNTSGTSVPTTTSS